MQGKMRRKDKLVTDMEWMESLLNEAQFLELGMVDSEGWPYIVPLGFGYSERALYFHGAASGKKCEILKDNPKACFQVYLDGEVERNSVGCEFDAKYRSLTGYGRVTILNDLDEKNRALEILMAHYDGPHEALREDNHARVWVARLDIESMTGKVYAGKKK